MVHFFKDKNELIYAIDSVEGLDSKNISKLEWLFVATYLKDCKVVPKKYLGPKKTMISPWSTNAVEITQNMAINGLNRIEVFELLKSNSKKFDSMLF